MTNSKSRHMSVPGGARSAFTLIEVLVVVAIIALLVSILLPALGEARDQARSARCLANMQDMGKGVNTFASSHRDRFQIFADVKAPADLAIIGDTSRTLFAYEGGPNAATPAFPNLLAWSAVLAKESGARSVKANADWGLVGPTAAIGNRASIRRFEQLICTSDKVEFGGSAAPTAPPHAPVTSWYYGFLSYVINLDIVGVASKPPKGVWKDGNGTMSPASGSALAGQLDKVIRPSEVMLFADGGPTLEKWTSSGGMGGSFSKHLGTGGPGNAPHPQDPKGPLLEYADVAYTNILRHERHRRNSVNITFADGHGSFVRKFPSTAYTGDPMIPTHKYLPKVRVSPYNAGAFP